MGCVGYNYAEVYKIHKRHDYNDRDSIELKQDVDNPYNKGKGHSLEVETPCSNTQALISGIGWALLRRRPFVSFVSDALICGLVSLGGRGTLKVAVVGGEGVLSGMKTI